MFLKLLSWPGFFLTPVFYSLERFGSSATLFGITFVPAQVMRWINPMASIIDGYPTVLWGTYESAGPVFGITVDGLGEVRVMVPEQHSEEALALLRDLPDETPDDDSG